MANLSIKTGTISRSMLVGNPAFNPSSFESIATALGTGASNTILFSSIPQTYKHLQLRFSGLATSGGATVTMRLNGDTGTNYSRHYLTTQATTITVGGNANANQMAVAGWNTGSSTTYPTVAIIDIHDYASTTKNKTVRIFSGIDLSTDGDVELNSGAYLNTSAITSISIIGSTWTTTSVFSLYGIKG
jgi:hypothetical protein